MAHILYFRGEGKAFLGGYTEYIVLVDAEQLEPEEIDGHTAPGFELHSDTEILEDIGHLPCGRILVAKF